MDGFYTEFLHCKIPLFTAPCEAYLAIRQEEERSPTVQDPINKHVLPQDYTIMLRSPRSLPTLSYLATAKLVTSSRKEVTVAL